MAITQEQHFNVYLTIPGDMWDNIAYKTLGSESKANLLYELNSELVKIAVFDGNIAIKIPEITELEEEVEAPWMK